MSGKVKQRVKDVLKHYGAQTPRGLDYTRKLAMAVDALPQGEPLGQPASVQAGVRDVRFQSRKGPVKFRAKQTLL